MSRKPKPAEHMSEERVRQARARHRAERLASLPPVPSQGGAYLVDGQGKLVPEGAETPVETPVKDA